jgi:lipopolysaccharide/colanic/teichoic acid biosynthesis glycosyltransferase
MIQGNRSRKIVLLLGDIILLFASLFITLIIRYGALFSKEMWNAHQPPFSLIYFIWIIVFYIAGFYDTEKKLFITLTNIIKAAVIGGIIAVLLFYLVPSFGIAPKTNLVINIFIASFFIWTWRKVFFNILRKKTKTKIFFLDGLEELADFTDYLKARPHLGFEIVNEISSADIIIVSEKEKQNIRTVKSLYNMVLRGRTVIDFEKFYESITGKIPVSLISEAWFLENLMEIKKQTFEKIKRMMDIILALFIFILLSIITPFVALAIKLNSKGPVFYKQKRLGKDGRIFEIVKFRSMIAEAEKNGAQWTKEKDERITFVGNIFRKTRIDELPQMINVLKGDLSFVGPRPERPEFVKELAEKIPHYSMRHLVKPGLSGWAQINFPYAASVEDAMEKLQYDLYYVKNRSLALEIAILLKTIMLILQRQGR